MLDCRSYAHVDRITPRCAIHMAAASQGVIDICVNFFSISPRSDVSQGPSLPDLGNAGLDMDSTLVSGRGACYAELSHQAFPGVLGAQLERLDVGLWRRSSILALHKRDKLQHLGVQCNTVYSMGQVAVVPEIIGCCVSS